MATDYSIKVFGTGTQDDIIIEDIVSSQVNLTETAMSDFSATIPKESRLRAYLQNEIRFIDNFTGEVVWYGTLEKWDEGETDIETNISGRGPLLNEKHSSVEKAYTSTFADDALENFNNNFVDTNIKFVTKDRGVRVKDTTITNDGGGSGGGSNTGTFENQVQIPDYQTRQFTEWEVAVKYAEPVSSSTVGISDTSGGADETKTQTVNNAQDEFIFSELTCASETGAPYIYVDIDQGSNTIEYLVAFATNSSQRYVLEEEVTDSVLSGLQRFSEIAGYRFGPLNYNNITTGDNTHILFPIGYEVGEPDWRILESNRSTDFANYANKVTVRGARNGNESEFFSATVEDTEEINTIGREIERYEKRVDLSSDAECRAVAKTILSAAVQNRGESGNLTVTIPSEKSNVPVGATSPISVWNNTFNDGGMVGTDALYFQQKDASTERVRTNSWTDDNSTYKITVYIYAHLDEMDRDAYIFSNDYEPEWLVLEQDGTLRATNPAGGGTGATITSPDGIIENRTTQEVTLILDGTSFEMRIDGEIVASTSTGEVYVMGPNGQVFGNRHRDTFRDGGFRVSDNGAVNLTWDEVSQTSGNFQNYGEAYSANAVANNTDWEQLNPGNSAYREGVTKTGTSTGPTFTVADDDSLNIGTGDLSAATWFKIDDTSTEYFLIEKNGFNASTEGWNLTIRSGDLYVEVSDGSTQSSYTIATGLSTDTWYHTGFAIDNSASLVEAYLDGVKTVDETYPFSGTDVSDTGNLGLLNTLTGGNNLSMDETRVWNDYKSAPSFETLAELGPEYSDVFRGGIDEIEFFDGISSSTHYFPLDSNETPDTAVDTVGGADATIFNVDYAAVSAPTREITYNFSDDVTASVKFDIEGRVDTELSNVRTNAENIKN